MRIGHGFDVHKLTDNRKLIIGGVDIPYEKGLLGHSDADVLTHAVMDSLLGAASLGDIGRHFPDTSGDFLNADSIELLKKVCSMINERGYKILNIDATVIAQKPKLKEFIPIMIKIISNACGISEDQINIKATTEEGLGYTGQGLGIAAHSVCLISKNE